MFKVNNKGKNKIGQKWIKNDHESQTAFTCLLSAIETPKQYVKYG